MHRSPPPALRHHHHHHLLLLLRLLPSPPTLRKLSSFPSDDDLAATISGELTKFASSSPPSLDLHQHLSLHFSGVRFTPLLLLRILNSSPSAGRSAADFFRWLLLRRALPPSDSSLSLLIHYLGRRRDFTAVHSALLEHRPSAGRLSLSAALLRLIRAGRPSQALRLFHRFPSDFNLPLDLPSLSFLSSSLCAHGFTSHAERAINRLADSVFPNDRICCDLIRGYCDELKLAEARRLMTEMRRGGFDLGARAYNAVLDCVCRICRRKDPLRMLVEARRVLAEMEAMGVRRDGETFHVVIYNLCKIRRTGDAMGFFREMGEWGCSAGGETYLVLIRSLYQAGRLAEGEEMVGFMRAAGFGGMLDRKAYYGFIKILCGIERVEHAMKVFRKMKSCGHLPGVKTYELLIGKLARHDEGDWAKGLFKEAVARGVPVVAREYEVDPRFANKGKKKKEKKKKRETLPEKMARKRRRLKRLRLSFVRKPKTARRFV